MRAETRTVSFNVRLTPTERAEIEKDAQEDKRTPSAYIRWAVSEARKQKTTTYRGKKNEK